jgi:sarcosine oxidase
MLPAWSKQLYSKANRLPTVSKYHQRPLFLLAQNQPDRRSPKDCDLLIAGLGAMGSSAAFHCARRGWKVIGLDRFSPPHSLGSSHGQTRIIREAYFEHPAYVPLVQHAYELWAELEKLSGERLFHRTGGLMIGPENGPLFSGALRSARQHGLEHQVLSAHDLHKRHPALHPAQDALAVWEPRAGILFPEKCIAAHLRMAREHGASIKLDEPILDWQPVSNGVRVRTAKSEYRAARMILCAGSWMPALLGKFPVPLRVERQILFWFKNRQPTLFGPATFPVFLLEHAPEQFFYGFPDMGNGVKIAQHHQGEATTPETVRRAVSPQETQFMKELVTPFLPNLTDPIESTVCMYTNTGNGHFLLDFHPETSSVLVASPCSGHGFKFSSVLGEIMANLLGDGETRFDLSLFRVARHLGNP